MARGRRHSAVAAAQPSGDEEARAVWRSAALVFLVALAIRLTHLWYLRRSPFFALLMGDSLSYDAWAQRIASGDWLGTGVFYQAPLYPYLLGIFYRVCGHDLTALKLAQIVLGSAGCSLLTLAGGRLFSARAGLAAGLLLGVFPVAVYFDALLQKTALDAVLVGLLLVAIASLARRPTAVWCFATGVVLGCLALTRENTLPFVAVVLAWIWISYPRRLIPVLVLVASFGAVLAPVAIRNLAVGGELHLTTSQLGPNLYIGNSEKATGTYVAIRSNRGSATYERNDAIELAEIAAGRSLHPSEVSRYWVGQSLAWMSHNPARWLGLMARKSLLVWNATEASDTEDIYTHADWSPVLRFSLRVFDFGVLAPLGLFGVWLTTRALALAVAHLGARGRPRVQRVAVLRARPLPLSPCPVSCAVCGSRDCRRAGLVEDEHSQAEGRHDCCVRSDRNRMPLAAVVEDVSTRRDPVQRGRRSSARRAQRRGDGSVPGGARAGPQSVRRALQSGRAACGAGRAP